MPNILRIGRQVTVRCYLRNLRPARGIARAFALLLVIAGQSLFAQITPGNALSVSPTSLSFSSQLSAPQPQQSQTVNVTSTVSGVSFSVSAATSSGGNWLSAYTYSSYTTGSTPQTVTVYANVSGIQTAGTYNGTVTVTAAGATNSPLTIPVTFTVTANTNHLTVSPTSLSFSSQLSAPQPQQSQTVNVTSTVSGVSFSVSAVTSSGGNWLSAYTYSSYTTGSTPQTVTVYANVSLDRKSTR